MREKARMLRSLAVLYGSGVPVDRSLDILAMPAARLRLLQGHPLSAALREVFPARVRAMLRLGEESGTLESVLLTLADEEEARSEQDQRLRSALAYPLFLLVVIVAVMLLAGPAVLRGTSDFVARLGGPPPAGLSFLRLLSEPATWVALTLAGAGLWRYLRRHPHLARRLPLVDRLWMARALARFCRNLAGALEAGVPLLQALALGAEASGHPDLTREVSRWRAELLQGRDLRLGIRRSPGLPAGFLATLALGLETGNTVRLLRSLAWLYEQDVEAATEALAGAAVPAVMLVMGGLVSLVIATLTGPLLKLVATL